MNTFIEFKSNRRTYDCEYQIIRGNPLDNMGILRKQMLYIEQFIVGRRFSTQESIVKFVNANIVVPGLTILGIEEACVEQKPVYWDYELVIALGDEEGKRIISIHLYYLPTRDDNYYITDFDYGLS